ncbi:competence type IV pilus minor pilin ComGD [Lederbergia graminis]|uniref:Competence type IV pilus minor pilin ComGD n=1 Tax=Lederbergia graminis TaxID=735518 RepID=A0ABW0LCP7_9BACI
MSNHSKGFTLIEVLIVITISTIILSTSVIAWNSFWETVQKRTFIAQLQTDLYYAHAFAINRQEPVTVSFHITNNRYQAETGKKEVLFYKHLPNNCFITKATINKFSISPQGTVSHFGTIDFQINSQPVRLSLRIGSGRFSFEE